MPVNGNYGSHGNHYAGDAESNLSSQPMGNATTASVPTPDSFGSQNANVPSSAGHAAVDSNKHAEIPKDQVGWHFVEQYYLNLSRSPNKLHVSPPPPCSRNDASRRLCFCESRADTGPGSSFTTKSPSSCGESRPRRWQWLLDGR